MYRRISVFLAAVLFAGLFQAIPVATVSAVSNVYYVSFSAGNDNNAGTSEGAPFKTLARLNQMTFSQGDTILLKCGDSWNEELILNGSGTEGNPITLSSYGTGDRPVLAPGGVDKRCITMNGLQGWIISNLELCNAFEGISMTYDMVFNMDYMRIENCYFHDMTRDFNSNPLDSSGKYQYSHFSSGLAIRGARDYYTYPTTTPRLPEEPDGTVHLTNLTVIDSVFENCDAGIWICKLDPTNNNARMGCLRDANFQDLIFTDCGMWGYSLKSLWDSTVTNVDCYNSGTVPVWCGSCSGLVESCTNVVLDGCDIYNAYRDPVQNYDGCGFDFEAWNKNVVYRNATIDGTDGCGIFVFDNGMGNINDDIEISNCVIKNFGLNRGNTCAGMDFTAQLGSGGGSCYNNTIYNTGSDNPFIGGNTSGWDFSGNTYTTCEETPVWTFNTGMDGWSMSGGIAGNISGQTLNLSISGSDQYIQSEDELNKDLSYYQGAILRMKNETSDTAAKLYWITDSDSVWNEAKSQEITIKGNDSIYRPYFVDLSTKTTWSGTLRQLRIEPVDNVTGGSVSIDSFRLCVPASTQLIEVDTETPATGKVYAAPNVWNFDADGNMEGWSLNSSIIGNAGGGSLNLTAVGMDPYITSPQDLGYNINLYNAVKLKMKNNTPDNQARVFWITDTDTVWDENKSAIISLVPNDSEYTEYTVYLRANNTWRGTLEQMRIDPMDNVASGSVSIDNISVCQIDDTPPAWEFNNAGNQEGWTMANSLSGSVGNGSLALTVTGADPFMISPDNIYANIDAYKYLIIKMKNDSLDWSGKLFWTTAEDTAWNEAKSLSFPIKNADTGYRTYVLDLGVCGDWNGILKQLRIDPGDNVSSGNMYIDSIALAADNDKNSAVWEFSTDGDMEGWTLTNDLSGNTAGRGLNVSVQGSDPYMHSPDFLNINLYNSKRIKIRMANGTYATTAKIYWTTTSDQSWDETKSATITLNQNLQSLNDYIVDLSLNSSWTGVLKQIRFDNIDQVYVGNSNIDLISIY